MTTADQFGDVLLTHGPNQGTITVEDGITKMTGGWETAIYLSLFGGNIDDDGTTATLSKTYWQNHMENEPDRKLISKTQYLLRSLPLTSSNIQVIETAVLDDLSWMGPSTSSIEASVRITGVNRIEITVTIETVGDKQSFTFSANWEAMRQ